MDWAIDLNDVAKTYGSGRRRVEALRGVSLQVRPGEIFGLLGPNGAGKTTLVKIMTTVICPTRAAGKILDRPVGSKDLLARVGYLPEHHRFPRYLTGRQMIEFFGALAGVDRVARKRRAAELLDRVGMLQWADRRLDTYSKGMMQRVGVAQSLINDPRLVVLDEPTDGVDPIGRKDILDVLRQLRSEGRTVFVNSHLLSELELICDRVAIMLKGQVVRQGTIPELAAHRLWYEIEITAETSGPVPAVLTVAKDGHSALLKGTLADGIWVEVESIRDGTMVRLGTTDAARIQPVLDRLRQAGCVIRRMNVVRPSLEELFIEAVTQPPALPAAPAPGVNA